MDPKTESDMKRRVHGNVVAKQDSFNFPPSHGSLFIRSLFFPWKRLRVLQALKFNRKKMEQFEGQIAKVQPSDNRVTASGKGHQLTFIALNFKGHSSPLLRRPFFGSILESTRVYYEKKRKLCFLPVLSDSPARMTFSALFLAIMKNSEVLPRYMYSMLRSLTRIGPSGSR